MADILVFILQFVLEVIFEGFSAAEYWRFYIPALLGILGALIIELSTKETLNPVLSAAAGIMGVVIGIVWQSKRG